MPNPERSTNKHPSPANLDPDCIAGYYLLLHRRSLEQRLQSGGFGLDLHETSRRRTQPGICSSRIMDQRLVEFFGVISDIESLIVSSFFTFHASFISKSSNGHADSLAKTSFYNRLLLLDSCPH